ncbi:gastrin/cholecystokinin-like peptide isoform X1 [Dendrobates tinctorius]|uniref:gastrin/cholecystokinin-like peptide isoform X1 n=1 Tax=Dendrobates tinctorius TaxID=92724 RepID=UPI003CC9825A
MDTDGREHPTLPSIKRCSQPAESQRHLLHYRPGSDTRSEMDRRVCVTILLAVLATAALCRPMAEQQSARYGPQKKVPFPSEVSRRDLLASLSHEQKQLMMSQLLPQLLAEMSNAEGHLHSMHDRDYAGWMDFGRRSAEDQVLGS